MVKKQTRKYFIPLYDRRVSRVFRFNAVLAMKIVPPPPHFVLLTLKSDVVVVGDCGKLFCKLLLSENAGWRGWRHQEGI